MSLSCGPAAPPAVVGAELPCARPPRCTASRRCIPGGATLTEPRTPRAQHIAHVHAAIRSALDAFAAQAAALGGPPGGAGGAPPPRRARGAGRAPALPARGLHVPLGVRGRRRVPGRAVRAAPPCCPLWGQSRALGARARCCLVSWAVRLRDEALSPAVRCVCPVCGLPVLCLFLCSAWTALVPRHAVRVCAVPLYLHLCCSLARCAVGGKDGVHCRCSLKREVRLRG